MAIALNRRSFLSGVAAAGLAAGITGCGSSSERDQNAANAKAKLPTYREYKTIRPDLRSSSDDLPHAYLRYPAKPVRAIDAPPGKGGTVSAMTTTYGPAPIPFDRNRYWHEFNRQAGVEFDLTVVPIADYSAKLATVVAGGDLPDLVSFATEPPRLPELLTANFADLAEYLAGDAITDYPMLANISTRAWRDCVFNGSLRALPVPSGGIGWLLFLRRDIIHDLGLNDAPASFAEFKELCVEVTNQRANRWALGAPGSALEFASQSLGLPQNWREEGGRFTHRAELEEIKQAMSEVVDMVKQELIHPDGLLATVTQGKDWLVSGQIALNWDGETAWYSYDLDEATEIAPIITPGFDGGEEAVVWASPATYSVTGIRKSEPARIRELLAICDWLATPFGTQEYLFRRYGIEGINHTLNGTDPVYHPTGASELLPVHYLTDAPMVLYGPGQADVTRAQHALNEQVVDRMIHEPTIGLYSETMTEKGVALGKILTTAQNDIFAGRTPLSEWGEVVKTWRKEGGDDARREYEEALADVS